MPIKLILVLIGLSQFNYWIGYSMGKKKQLEKDQGACPNVKLQSA